MNITHCLDRVIYSPEVSSQCVSKPKTNITTVFTIYKAM